MRRPPGPRNARSTDDTKPNETRAPPDGRRGGREHGGADGAVPDDQAIGGAPVVSTLDDGQVAVPVDALGGADGGPAAGEADGDLAAAQVVGVGEHAAVGDDDAGTAKAGADPDDGRADGGGDGGDGLLELVEHGHER